MGKFTLVATATFGLESIVANELKFLGFENIQTENGRVIFTGNEIDICIANIHLRCADRVFILLKEFKALTFEELFQGVKSISWEKYLTQDACFPIYDAKSVKSKLFSLSDIQSISKKAIVERLKEHYEASWFSEEGAKYPILVSILKDRVSVLMDTSGVGLHKRGYRQRANDAPIKETLAAGLLLVSRWNKKIPLIDPLCGSGTIPIEAAMIGANIAPGLSRSFISQNWSFIDSNLWKSVKKEAFESIDYDANLNIKGYDLDENVINLARENAENAGVEEFVSFDVKDAALLNSEDKYGYILSNPPYGERLGEEKEVQRLYQKMGKSFQKLDTWGYYIITSMENFEEFFGKKATKNRKLYNGKLKCYFYQYLGQKPPKKKF